MRVVLPLIAAHLREWAVIAGAMAATALLFGVYPFLHAPLAMGVCSVLLGVALGRGAAHDHEHAAPDHAASTAMARRSALRMMAINASSVTMPMLFGAGRRR